MKRTFFLMQLFAISLIKVCGQADSSDIHFIHDVFKPRSSYPVVYLARSHDWKRITESLTDTIIKSRYNTLLKDSLVLTSAELNYLRQQADINKNYVWPDSLLPSSQRFENESDTLFIFLHHQFNIYRDNINTALINKDSISLQRFITLKPWVYVFSKPIYFRNGELCIFYSCSFCGGLCGEDEVSLYRKEKDKWVKWILISHGDY